MSPPVQRSKYLEGTRRALKCQNIDYFFFSEILAPMTSVIQIRSCAAPRGQGRFATSSGQAARVMRGSPPARALVFQQ